MNILITGGAGFIGANFCHYVYNKSDNFVCLDALTYAGNKENIEDLLNNQNFKFVLGNICDEELVDKVIKENKIDVVVNFAAESHVENSIKTPQPFIDTNITGVRVLLDACKKHNVKRFHQVSTDEVYGELKDGDPSFLETSPLKPTNPYSISKAAADLLVLSYNKMFNLDITISRCSNNYGIYQHKEKFVSKSIQDVINNRNITVHGDGKNIRDWINVLDHCEGIKKIIESGRSGEIYNIGSSGEKTNLEVAKIILSCFKDPKSKIEFVENRKNNDYRYSINYDKISKELGYKPKYTFENSIQTIIDWYKQNLNQGVKMEKAKVYFSKNITGEEVVKLYKKLGVNLDGKVAVKVHSGEVGNQNFIRPEFFENIIKEVDGTVVECNTAYEGERNTTKKHKKAMEKHGWSKYFAVDILDETGDMELPIKEGKHLSINYVGNNMKNYDSMLVLSHFKGHPMGGFGGAIKNISIGLASSYGKAVIHGAGNPKEKWTADHDSFLESMVEASETILDYYKDKIIFINVMKNMSVDCDCCAKAKDPEIADIGILASTDPLALDRACVDLVYASNDKGKKHLIKRIESRNGIHTLDYAIKRNLGNENYELIEI